MTRKLVIVTSRFPFGGHEAFLAPELDELAKHFERIVLVPVHPVVSLPRRVLPDRVDVLGWPLIGAELVRRAAMIVRRHPNRAAHAVSSVLRSRDRGRVKNLTVIVKALALADWVIEHEFDHIHSYWMSTPATVAHIAAAASGVAWSATAHRWDIYERNAFDVKERSAAFVRTISTRGTADLGERMPRLEQRVLELRLGALVPPLVDAPAPGPRIPHRLTGGADSAEGTHDSSPLWPSCGRCGFPCAAHSAEPVSCAAPSSFRPPLWASPTRSSLRASCLSRACRPGTARVGSPWSLSPAARTDHQNGWKASRLPSSRQWRSASRLSPPIRGASASCSTMSAGDWFGPKILMLALALYDVYCNPGAAQARPPAHKRVGQLHDARVQMRELAALIAAIGLQRESCGRWFGADRFADRSYGGRVSALKRLAIGFPLQWSHRRAYSLAAIAQPGKAPYFIEWDPGNGTFGEDWTNAPRDSGGVLLVGPSRWYHPILISQFALHRFCVWHSTHDAEALNDFLAQAAWLRDHQSADGVPGLYRFEFPWVKYGASVGWCSAMAQGEAISVLLRADHLAPGQGFGEAAVRASLPFYADIGRGGVTWRTIA